MTSEIPVKCSTNWCFHILLRSSSIWSFMYSLAPSPSQTIRDQLPDGLKAQLVEHCTGIAEFIGSNHVQAWILFFSLQFYSCLSCEYNWDDLSCLHINSRFVLIFEPLKLTTTPRLSNSLRRDFIGTEKLTDSWQPRSAGFTGVMIDRRPIFALPFSSFCHFAGVSSSSCEKP